MTYKPTLLIIAAGMGSRYGGLKQIDPVGPNGEIIIDYSVYDAIRAGFQKIVFVIRHCFEEAFRKKIGNKLTDMIETAYVYQKLDACLNGFDLPKDREKPWGTAHAILVAQNVIDQPFAVINADDYYGPNAHTIMKQHLDTMAMSPAADYVMVGYVLRNTLSEYGNVTRGVCQYDPDMYLSGIIERTGISKCGKGALFKDEGGIDQKLIGDEIVSMNLWGFTPDIFDHLQQQFSEYLKEHGQENKSEFYIPTVVDNLLKNGQKKVKILKTTDSWFGVTYRQDKVIAQSCILKLIKQNVYPENLWENRSG